MSFVHLHTHSEYSLLDGAVRLSDLVVQAAELGMPAVALTDHGVMYGAVDFYKKAKQAGVKPILGCELYVAPRSRHDKSRGEEGAYHLTLLATDHTGYRNLMHLCSLGFLEGFYYRPRVDKELLAKYSEGLIALSGCMTGEVARLAAAGRADEARAAALAYRDIFGAGNFYIELQDQGMDGQKELNERLAQVAADTGIPLVATNDVHYLRQQDSTAHDVLLCIQTGATLDEQDRLRFQTDQFYLRSSEEMAVVFSAHPEALTNTIAIAERCDVELELGKILLPHYDVPEGHSLESYLEELCREGIKRRYAEVTPEVSGRLDYELSVIKQTGFSGYFLVVWDFINFARSAGIKVGPGRGSAAGSIVSYALGITSIDPLLHGLLFERFLNPERVSMPDIDIDFCYVRRDEVIRYVAEKYGQDRVAQIITFSTMAARAAIRDAGRVFGIPYGQVDRIAKLIPEVPGVTLDKSMETVPELKLEYENNEEARKILDTARTLEGLVRQDSIHAAGVVIAEQELPNYVPIQRKPNTEVVTQYSMDAIKDIGLLKMDFLGLRTLTVINDAVQIIKRTRGEELDIDALPLDDKKTYRRLQKGDSVGLFQLESSGMRGLMRDLQPTAFADIVALLALYRPGPLQSQMVKDFVDRKHGRQPITYMHPALEPVLKETYGIIVYQEQVMRIATELAGFSLAEADILRGAMSKKKPEVLAKQREKFVAGADRNGIDKKTAGKVFDLVDHFAGYGFNKSHSTAYAVISYQTAYLKAHYPVEFMAALLTSIMDNKDKVAQYVNECRHLRIDVLPPDVNESLKGFTAVDGKIRFGLSAVRNVGEAAIETIIAARRTEGAFTTLHDFCRRVDANTLNKRALESLIKAGAFDSLGQTRKHLLATYEQAVDNGVKHRRDRELGQFSLFGDDGAGAAGWDEPPAPASPDELPKEQLLSYEKEMLGLYVSDNPLLAMADVLRSRAVSLSQIREMRDGSTATVGGLIGKISKITTRKGEPMAFVNLEDLEGSIEVVVFPMVYQRYSKLLVDDQPVLVVGRIDVKEDEVKVIAQDVEALVAEQRPAAKTERQPALYLRVQSERLDRTLLGQLKTILRSHPGQSEVFLQLKEDQKTTTMRLSTDFQVASEGRVISELSDLLGRDAVAVT